MQPSGGARGTLLHKIECRSLKIANSENGTTDFYRILKSSVRPAGAGVAAGAAHSGETSGNSDLQPLRDGTPGRVAADDIFYCRALSPFGGASGRIAAHDGRDLRILRQHGR